MALTPGLGANLNQSKRPPDRNSRTPVIEEGQQEEHLNIAYRGDVDHGVPLPVDHAWTLDETIAPDDVVAYQVDIEEPTPIPVKVVQESAGEWRSFRTFHTYIAPGATGMIVGRHDSRTQLIINSINGITDGAVYIGSDATNSLPMHGFMVKNATLTIAAQCEVWASAPAGNLNPIELSCIEQFTISTD